MMTKTERMVKSIRSFQRRAGLTINEISADPLHPANATYTVWESPKAAKEKNGAFAVFNISGKEINGKDDKSIGKEVYEKLIAQQNYLAQSKGYHPALGKAAKGNAERLKALPAKEAALVRRQELER